ncbi:MAG: type II glyceraldehyde-3-phosphate dehydrogenase, partial [Thermoproteota archaeon]|nr:type II glyceraldehyde-3-phosphate dehydrogenase [Thermoproteota archaeon]
MPNPKVKVVVNGYGVIGKRVVDAVNVQDDMTLVGVCDVVADWRVQMAQKKGYQVYCSVSDQKRIKNMKDAGIDVAGTLEELLKQGAVDVVVDCAPGGFGAKNKQALYDKHNVKAIFEGGEKHEVAGLSFVCQCNYDEVLKKAEDGHRYCRVVSCNTTAGARILHAFYTHFKVPKTRMFLVRRATDPPKADSGGIMNTVVPAHLPSHHAPDIKTVIHDAVPDLYSAAVKGSHTQYHFHFYDITLGENVTRRGVLDALREEPRTCFVSTKDGVMGLAAIIEMSRDIGLPRGDVYT